MKFTDKYIANLKPKAKMYQQREGKGFGVRVLPSGHKIWIFTYTHDGKRRQMNLGSYPEKSLVDARAAHAAAYAALNDPTNPRDPQSERDQKQEAERQAREERRKAPTVEDLADEHMKKHAIPNKKTWKRDEFCLNNDILPALGEIKAQDVRKRDVVLLLEKIVERGAPGQARSVLEVMRRMFTFAVERDILETSPMFGVKPLTKKVARDRVLTADEIKTFWAGLDKLSTRGNDKETGRSFKIGYGNGRSLKYQIGNDGELIVTPDKPGIYTPNDYKAMLKAITRDIERRNRAMEKSKKTGTRWSRAPMLLQKPRTIASRQWEQPKPPKAKAEPPRVETKMQEQPQSATQPPQAPLDSRGRYDLSKLNGHQIAALKNGLDPMTPGVENMSAQDMKNLAAEQTAASVAGVAERAGLAYVRDPRPRRF